MTAALFEVGIFVAVTMGVVGACWGALSARGSYDEIGRGYLDVADADPCEQGSDEPFELTEARQMREATRSLRAARERRSAA